MVSVKNERAVRALSQLLPQRLIREGATTGRGTVALDERYGGRSITPVWVGQGYPSDLERHIEKAKPGIVFVARQFSKSAQEILSERNLNWADETGRIHIDWPPLLIERQGPIAGRMQRPADKWTPAVATVAEQLLVMRSRGQRSGEWPVPKVAELAALTETSPANITRALQFFDEQTFTVKSGGERGTTAQRVLADPTDMLSSWAAWYRRVPRRTLTFHALVSDPVSFASTVFDEMFGSYRWAVTGWVAASLIAPFGSQIPNIAVYVDEDWNDRDLIDLARRSGLRQVDSGARVKVHRADAGVWAGLQHRNGLPLASSVRVFGDLWRTGSRAEEAAEHLRRYELGW